MDARIFANEELQATADRFAWTHLWLDNIFGSWSHPTGGKMGGLLERESLSSFGSSWVGCAHPSAK